MEKLIGYGVVGLGVGSAHVKGAAKAKGGKLVAICDVRQDRIDRMVNELKEKDLYDPSLKTYLSYEDMLADAEIDVVSVCTPSGMHADMAIQALRAGKHVLCEKPMDIAVDKILEIDRVAKEVGKKAACIFQNRTLPCIEPIKKALEEGRLGTVYTGFFRVNWYRSDKYFTDNGGWRGTWAMDGGGSLMNQGVHTVDLMQYLMGDVVSVQGNMRIVNHAIETEDFTNSLITFKNGALVNLISTTSAYPGLGTEIQITGTKGSIHMSGDNLSLWLIEGETMREEQADMLAKYGGGSGVAAADPSIVRGHDFMVQDIIDAVRFDRAPFVPPAEAAKAVRIVNAVYESSRSGKPVVF